MSHVIVDIVLIAVGLLIVLLYARRGFLKSLIHSMKTVLAFVIAYFLGGKLATLLADAFVSSAVRESVYKKVSSLYASGVAGADELGASFPSFMINEDVRARLDAATGSGEEWINTVTDAIAAPMTDVISTVIGYIAVFVISLIGLWILAAVLNRVIEYIAVLNFANILLGGILGLLLALALLFVVGSTVKFFAADTAFYAESTVLKFFGDFELPDALQFLDISRLLA